MSWCRVAQPALGFARICSCRAPTAPALTSAEVWLPPDWPPGKPCMAQLAGSPCGVSASLLAGRLRSHPLWRFHVAQQSWDSLLVRCLPDFTVSMVAYSSKASIDSAAGIECGGSDALSSSPNCVSPGSGRKRHLCQLKLDWMSSNRASLVAGAARLGDDPRKPFCCEHTPSVSCPRLL